MAIMLVAVVGLTVVGLGGCGAGLTGSHLVLARTAPGQTVPGQTCHARGSGLYSLPDPRCTPGAIDPAVTQANIASTICRSGYTRTVRPPESITEVEKRASMDAYGDAGPPEDYEYDHLIPLELGGAANDPRNLWPEPGASPNPKDLLENRLRALVCAGALGLRAAQREIAANWIAVLTLRYPSPGRPPNPSPGWAAGARR
jgi:hypothetical protein